MLASPRRAGGSAHRRLVARLAQAAGARGMVLGQALDIAAETVPAPLTLDEIIALQAGKTGALIRWAADAGALLRAAETEPLPRYGAALGLAFQIADDVLDVEGDAEAPARRWARMPRRARRPSFRCSGSRGPATRRVNWRCVHVTISPLRNGCRPFAGGCALRVTRGS